MTYPLCKKILYQDPVTMFALFAKQEGALFLDSAQLMPECGRYSFIAIDPFLTFSSKNGEIFLNKEKKEGDPLQELVAQFAAFSLASHPGLPPFQGGVAGFFAYDLYQHIEKIIGTQLDDMQFPDLALGFYDLVIAFDQELKKAWIFSSGFPLKEEKARFKHAEERCDALIQQLKTPGLLPQYEGAICQEQDIHANFSSDSYQAAVNKVKNYILEGDIFEANISQQFRAVWPNNVEPFDLYQRLRNINPATFSAYFCFEGTVIASASPERFLKLVQHKVETRPIKGTRPRGKTEQEDKQWSEELLHSEKDHAENVMIVDLLRNDLSRVCEDHSVRVPQLCGLESYATVHHLVSVVTGTLQKQFNAIDLLRASFPGGSITGAPKIRAMEIIAEIEPTKRGPYCGSMGYIGFDGNMDTSIIIRTFAIKNNWVTFQAGGAIVADSDPLEEYKETLTKANALRRALTE